MSMNAPLLSTYLNDHLAGATAGRNLARRAATNNKATQYGAQLADVAREIAEDRVVLQHLMASLDVTPNRAKTAAAAVAERLARAKANRRLFSYSPLSRVDEIEGLVVGVRGKLALWTALRTLQATESRIAAIGLPALIERAEDQLARLEDLRLGAFQEAMLGAAPDRD